MSKKSKLDLLVRVRYQNPLPAPPFPPKLFSISSDINQLGEPSYLGHLAASIPLPMLVDSEMGMPLDLSSYEGVWDGNDLSLNPLPGSTHLQDSADIALLVPFRPLAKAEGVEKIPTATEVSWMRNSNLFTRKVNARRREAVETGDRADAAVDASEAAQIMAIDKTFSDIQAQDPFTLRHPDSKKRHLKVVESYDILPDDEAWANEYIMIRFPERPSAATAANPSASASSPRLSTAVLRPIIEEDQQIMEFYLPKEDDLVKLDLAHDEAVDAERLQQIADIVAEDGNDPRLDGIFPSVHYDRIRTYDVVKQDQPVKELLVSFVESEGGDEKPRKKRKGVYYNSITMRALLRKTRATRRGDQEIRADAWDKARVGFRMLNDEEVEGIDTASTQVRHPLWANVELRRLHGGENMAEGQGEAIDDEEPPMDEGADRAEHGLEG